VAGKRKLTIEILGDEKDATKAFKNIEKSAGKMGSKLGKVAKGAALAVGGIATAGIGAAVILGPKVLELGGKLEVVAIKSATVFEDAKADVEAWAKASAKSMGLTTTEAIGLAANMGDLLKPMGFTSAEAAKMSAETTDLAGALAAWTGGTKDAAEVSDILSKAMLGEREGLKALGISILESDVKQRLLENGTNDLTGAALQQARAIATQQLIMEKSTDAQTAWTDGSMDAMKAQMQSDAAIKQVKESLVQALYPAMQAALPFIEKLATWMGENLPEAMEVVSTWVEENWPQIRDTIVQVIDKITEIVAGFTEWFQNVWARWGDEIMLVITTIWPPVLAIIEGTIETIKGILKTALAIIRGDWDGAWKGIKEILSGVWSLIKGIVRLGIAQLEVMLKLGWEAIKNLASAAWDGFKDLIGAAWQGIKDLVSGGIDAVVDFVAAIPGRISDVAKGAFDGIKDAFKAAINWIIDGWNGLEFKLPGFDPPGPGPKFGGFTIGTPNIPRLHDGGRVGGQSFKGLADTEVVALLRRDETVLTTGQTAALAQQPLGPTNTFVYSPEFDGGEESYQHFVQFVDEHERRKAGAR